jgi:hypothetical protein
VVLAVTVTALGAVPLVGAKLNHAALEEAVQFNVPPPEFEMFNVWDAGPLPPWIPLNVKLAGLNAIVGDAA